MINSVSKQRLPKELRYVLKTSLLAETLASANIETHVDLLYYNHQAAGSILQVFYWLPNGNVPYPRFYITSHAVPLNLYSDALEALIQFALPEFVRWATEIQALPESSPILEKELYFNARYTSTGLTISYEAQYMVKRRG